jgi:outer membrane protein
MSPMHFSGLLRKVRQCLPLLVLYTAYARTSPAEAVAAPATGGKYAVVDMQAVILNVEEGKQARAELEKQIKAKEKARLSKQKEFQEKFMSLRSEEMSFQNEIKGKEQAATQKIAIAVSKLVNEMAKQRGLEMVFETNSAGLLYLKDPVDMTKDVIDAFEAQSKKGNTAKK